MYYFSDDSVDVTSEPLDQDVSVAASHNPNKRPQMEVQLGGAVTLQCPQGKILKLTFVSSSDKATFQLQLSTLFIHFSNTK